ncbi:MAG TPA: hypothetical protein VF032_17395 [Thermoleophilaceae bacterium]
MNPVVPARLHPCFDPMDLPDELTWTDPKSLPRIPGERRTATPRRRSAPTPRRVCLTPRDQAILEHILVLDGAPLEHLAAHHFRGTRKTALNRLRLLVRAGYLHRQEAPLLDKPSPTSFYRLTRQGLEKLRLISLLSDRLPNA